MEALANGLTAADVNLNTVFANVDSDVQDSTILSEIVNEILKGNEITVTVLERVEVSLLANMDAIILAFIDALENAGINVNAVLASLNIN